VELMTAETLLLDLGDFGEVAMDPVASYVRSRCCGHATDPRMGQQFEAACEAIREYRLRYVISDVSQLIGLPTMEFLERIIEMTPPMAAAGCQAHIAILPSARPVLTNNARTQLRLQREHGMSAVEVFTFEEALRVIATLRTQEAGPEPSGTEPGVPGTGVPGPGVPGPLLP
jgi:hypothetical protein